MLKTNTDKINDFNQSIRLFISTNDVKPPQTALEMLSAKHCRTQQWAEFIETSGREQFNESI